MTGKPDITEPRRVAAEPGARGTWEMAACILHRAVGPRTRRTALRSLLWALAQALVLAARLSSSVRLQITRSFTFEISTDDGVARQWVFDKQRRRVTTSAGSPNTADYTLRFTSSREALRVLASPDAVDRMADLSGNGPYRRPPTDAHMVLELDADIHSDRAGDSVSQGPTQRLSDARSSVERQ
jgi:hypothetical protein